MNNNTVPCPLCDQTLHFVPLGQYWTCDTCPAILMEYVDKGDAHKVAEAIELNNKNMEKRTITTQEEARQYAIEWDNWTSTQDISMLELIEWQVYFGKLAEQFNLEEEFKENGII